MTIIIVVSCYLLFMLFRMQQGCFDEYPREYRDVANSVLALRFAAGENPYILPQTGEVPAIYVYTPLNILIATGIYLLTGFRIYTIFHCLDFVYLCAACGLVANMVAKETKSKIMGFVSIAVTITLGYRYCFVQACPDRLGILLLVLVVYIAGYYNGRYRILLLSFITTMAFYAKQYFLVIAVPVFFYVLYKNRKEALHYFLLTACMGFGSIAIVNHFCPMFTMEILLFMGVETSKPTADDFAYSMMQFVEFFKRYIWLTLPIIVYYIQWCIDVLRILIQNKKLGIPAIKEYLNRTVNAHFICVPTMILVLTRIGQNRGAYLSYHLGLLGPCFVVLGFIAAKYYIDKLPRELWKQFALGCFSVILTVTCYHFYSVLNINKTELVQAEWERAYDTLDGYRELGEEMYLDPTLAYYALEHNLPIYDCGQTFFVYWIASGVIKDKPIDSEAYDKVFPLFSEFETYSKSYVSGIAEKIDNKEFGCIAVMGDSLANRDLTENYVHTDTVNLKMGVQNFDINIWEREKE